MQWIFTAIFVAYKCFYFRRKVYLWEEHSHVVPFKVYAVLMLNIIDWHLE